MQNSTSHGFDQYDNAQITTAQNSLLIVGHAGRSSSGEGCQLRLHSRELHRVVLFEGGHPFGRMGSERGIKTHLQHGAGLVIGESRLVPLIELSEEVILLQEERHGLVEDLWRLLGELQIERL